MSLHKLTAGDGYRYLTRQVAVHDVTERGFSTLENYYSARGESPGRWMGRGLAGLHEVLRTDQDLSLAGLDLALIPGEGEKVSEAQMLALFGRGLHPAAEGIRKRLTAAEIPVKEIEAAVRLGSPYRVYEGDTQFRRRLREAFAQHNRIRSKLERSSIPEPVRARIRSEVAQAMFVEHYGRQALDDRERAGWMARLTRQRTTSVAGYDLAFSPVKSVSALWAIAVPEVAEQIRLAHEAAVADVLSWLEDEAAFTRLGRDGVRQVPVRGLIAAVFVHRDSRAGDPDLHTHVAISNKVQALDGRWRALDGRPIHAMTVAASERYNTRLETHLRQRLGVQFAARTAASGKRVVREIVGVPGALLTRWSTRRAAIDERRGALAAVFQDQHGRPPSSVEAFRLAQQATLETRPDKHAPRSLAEQRAGWRQEAIAELGSAEALEQVVALAVGSAPAATSSAGQRGLPALEGMDLAGLADVVVRTVAAGRATWGQAHVRAEAERQVRTIAPAGCPVSVVDDAVGQLTGLALDQCVRLDPGDQDDVARVAANAQAFPQGDGLEEGSPVVPAVLLRGDGSSVYRHVQERCWTSPEVVDAERLLLALAGRMDGARLDPLNVEMALLESMANASRGPLEGGFDLNEGQAGLIRELTLSGARLQVGLAPAGTGKTTAMSLVSQAWTAAGGNVVGLAPSAAAADVLRRRLHGQTDTIAKLLHIRSRPVSPVSRFVAEDEWAWRIGPGTLIVIDEAGMASTTDLAAVARIAIETGASIRLIGDDQQLAAVEAGGVLRDITRQFGAATLTDVVRFTDPVEGAASLALRAGDEAAIGWYLDHERVHVGDDTTAPAHAFRAWRHDVAVGRDSILLAPTHDLVTTLNLQARAERLAQPRPSAESPGTEVTLADTTQASAGDTVLTTRNARSLRYRPEEGMPGLPGDVQDGQRWVMNGDRWLVESVTIDGGLQVRHHRTGGQVLLPADYVRQHVRLGYAATIHAGQGLSVDTAHVVAGSADLTRQLLYVAMTRGRDRNDLYLATASDGEEHALVWRDTLLPPTAADLIARILRRDGAQISATSTVHHLAAPHTQLKDAAARYYDALHTGIDEALGSARIQELADAAEQIIPDITQTPAWPALANRLARLDLTGTQDPIPRLARAASGRELGTARDVAAVLDWRIAQQEAKTSPSTNLGSAAAATGLPWLPELPPALDADPLWGPYLRARAHLAAEHAVAVKAISANWTVDTAPAWASTLIPLTTQHAPAGDTQASSAVREARDLIADLAVWRACRDIPDSELAPAGPQPVWADERRHHGALNRRLHRLLDHPYASARRWAALLPEHDSRVASDPWWPELASRLDALSAAGVDAREALETVLETGQFSRPLPDEYPAAALWWRISQATQSAAATEPGELPVLNGDGHPLASESWHPVLARLLGDSLAAWMVHDPTFNGLAQAVRSAVAAGWLPEQILSVAVDHLHDLHPGSIAQARGGSDGLVHDVALPRVTPALTGYIRTLLNDPTTTTDQSRHPQETGPEQPENDALPPDPLDEKTRPPEDANVLDAAPTPTVERTDHPHDVAEPKPASRPTENEKALRTRELMSAAADYYAQHLDGSWAQAYLLERLALEPGQALPEGHRAGYAPEGWTSLIDHLRVTCNAKDEELLASGLAKRTRSGNLIDVFRDRLVLTVHASGPTTRDAPEDSDGLQVVAFVARRHPRYDAQPSHVPDHMKDRAGPKYLNTGNTDLYAKGRSLYGLAGNETAVQAGAVLVLAEGPMDAMAITLAGQGRYVGIAALGTAFTPHQAHQIAAALAPPPSETHRPTIAASNRAMAEDTHGHEQQAPPPEHRLLIATDADSAGDQAAEHIYYMLTDIGLTGLGRLVMPPGTDPAQLLASAGAPALQANLDEHHDLASHLITVIAQSLTDTDRQFIEERVRAGRAAAQVITRQPPAYWPQLAAHASQALELWPDAITALIREAARTRRAAPASSSRSAAHPEALPPRPAPSPALRR